MEALREISGKRRVPVIEDACQAIRAEQNGCPAGSMGDIGCFSFYPTKNLGGFGDGGIITTNRDDLAARLRLLRVHGMEPRYFHQVVGINSRLDTIQAAVLNVKLPHLDQWADLRRANAERYDWLFRETGLARLLSLPTTSNGCKHVWNQYTIRVGDGRRDALRQYLLKSKSARRFTTLCRCISRLAFVRSRMAREVFLNRNAACETLALPIFAELEAAEIETVVYRIAEFFGIRRPQIDPAVRRPHFLTHPASLPEGLPKVA